MITSIKNVRNKILLFPGVIELKPGLNLIGGGNGVGKTTLLKEIRLWSLSKGRHKDDSHFTNLFRTEESLQEEAAGYLQVEVTDDGTQGRCLFWQNAKDNHRYTKPDFFNPNLKQIDRYYSTGERSEGENLVESLITWLEESSITGGDVVLLDEIDSGLSVDACNGVLSALLALVKRTGCQVIATCNSFHFPYVLGGMINLLDGSYVEFGRSYEEFCKFSHSNARKLVPIREKARKKAQRAQAAEARRRETAQRKERERRERWAGNKCRPPLHSP